jgi:hypothetical protein
MRVLLAACFAALALWRAWIDWQATIGTGYAYRLASTDAVLAANFPRSYARVQEMLEGTGISFLWDPVLRTLLGLPLALAPAVIAILLWLTLPRARGRG